MTNNSFQNFETIKVDLKKGDILLIRNVLSHICYGAHTLSENRFEPLLGKGNTAEYVGSVCDLFRKAMEENNIVD